MQFDLVGSVVYRLGAYLNVTALQARYGKASAGLVCWGILSQVGYGRYWCVL